MPRRGEAEARLRPPARRLRRPAFDPAVRGERGQVLAHRVVADAQAFAQRFDAHAFGMLQQVAQQRLPGFAQLLQRAHLSAAFAGNCLAIAPASASAIVSMCACIAFHVTASALRSPRITWSICAAWCAPCATSRPRTASSGRFGLAAARNVAISPALLRQCRHRLAVGGLVVGMAGVGHRLDRAPVPGQQCQHPLAGGLAVEAGDRIRQLLGIGDHRVARLRGALRFIGLDRERVIAGGYDVAVPQRAQRGLQLRGRHGLAGRRGLRVGAVVRLHRRRAESQPAAQQDKGGKGLVQVRGKFMVGSK